MDNERLISHSLSPDNFQQLYQLKKNIIIENGDKPYASVQQQLKILEQLLEFDFGRFLLQNRGINGYWTHYILTYPWTKPKTVNSIETFLLEKSPSVLATQERFQIFLNENQKSVHDNATLACIPSGLMGELLYLNFSKIHSIKLIGIDYDQRTLLEANLLAQQCLLQNFCEFSQADAWQLNLNHQFDLISSNGLNIYEPDDDKVVLLYQQFYQALKPGGKLVTSFLTPPPGLTETCEWKMDKINQDDLILQRIIFSDILQVKWQCFRSTTQTKQQLETVGFNQIHFIPDQANLFPTVVAIK